MTAPVAKPSVAHLIDATIQLTPGLTDRELTDRILGAALHPSPINQACRLMASKGLLSRRLRADGRIGNYRIGAEPKAPVISPVSDSARAERVDLSEDDVKRHLSRWLEAAGWAVTVAWGKARGADIVARRANLCWIIEAKGAGSLQPMRVNYFLAILGETLQRMDNPGAKYSIAIPDLAQFRGLWHRLPDLAKQRTGITAVFVSLDGQIEECT